MSSNFAEQFPALLEQARDLQSTLLGVAMVVLFAGVVISGWRGSLAGDTAGMLRTIATTGIIALVIEFFPDWVDELRRVSHALMGETKSDPSQTHVEFAHLITGADEGEDVGFWDVLWSEEGGMGKALIYVFVLLIGQVAWLFVWLAYLMQHVISIFAIAVSPAFLAMFALDATRGVAIKFILSLLGVILWPLGWAVADIVTDALLSLAVENRIYALSGPVVSGTQTLSFILMLSIWILASTMMAPRLISQAIQSGSQIGAALLGGFGSAVGQGVSYGVGAGVTARLAGASPGVAGAAGVAGGAGGVVSGALGTSGVLVPAAIGAMAVAAATPSSGQRDVNAEAAAIARKNR